MSSCDLIIVGGGPAGLSAAIYAGRADLSVRIVERQMVGGQVALTKDIANFPGFPEAIDGRELAERMRAQAERFGVRFDTAEVRDISRTDAGGFRLHTRDETIDACAVIVATGSDPRKLHIPGEEEFRGRGVSYCGTCDAPFFRGRRVAVVGGGDAAFKEALHIAKFASDVLLVHRREGFRAEKIYQEELLRHERIEVRTNTVVTAVLGETKAEAVRLEHVVTKEAGEEPVDGLFVFIGSTPNTRLICSLVPANCNGHIETDLDMMTAVPGLFAVGDVREHSYRQVATAVGEGATAAIAAEHYIAHGRRGAT
jgi:thioredoxin reductase (NADPH)